MKRSHITVLSALAALPLLVSACSSSSSSSSTTPAAPVSSSVAAATESASGAPLDRDAALAELQKQVTTAGFSADAASCITDWASTLSDADLAIAASPPGTDTPEPQKSAQAEALVTCARPEVVDQLVTGIAAAESMTDSAKSCTSDYLTGLTDAEVVALTLSDATQIASLKSAKDDCVAQG